MYQLSHDIDVGRFQTLMECLTGNFEEVKILAFDLLMKLPKTFVQFQVFGLFFCKCKCDVCMKISVLAADKAVCGLSRFFASAFLHLLFQLSLLPLQLQVVGWRR